MADSKTDSHEVGQVFVPGKGICLTRKRGGTFVKPYVRIIDLNNQNEQDRLDCNMEKPAVEIGLKFSF